MSSGKTAFALVALVLAAVACDEHADDRAADVGRGAILQGGDGPTQVAPASANDICWVGGFSVSAFAVYAHSGVLLGERAEVAGGHVGVNDRRGASPRGPTAVTLASHSSTDVLRTIYGASISINERAIAGTLATDRLIDRGGRFKNVIAFPAALPPEPQGAPAFPGPIDLTVPRDRTRHLAGGARLRDVELKEGATLQLGDGRYDFRSLEIGERARLEITGNVEVRVAGRMSVGERGYIGPEPGRALRAKSIRVLVGGRDDDPDGRGDNGRAAVVIGANADVRGLLLSSEGTIDVKPGASIRGALAGDVVRLGARTRLVWEDGFPPEAAPAREDDNPCTTDVCDPIKGPVHAAAADGTSCDDRDLCTATDVCQAGVCVGTAPKSCTAIDQCHDTGTCNRATGQCTTPAKTDGVACDDGDACTRSDSCKGGACVGSNPVVCEPASQCHDAGTCNTSTGICSQPLKLDGANCDDGDACTLTDLCVAGVCSGSEPVECVAADQCRLGGTCNPATGTCSDPFEPDGTPCSDGNLCTSADQCMGGFCVAGAPVVIDDGNVCTNDSCNPNSGVAHVPREVGTSCSDGNRCNGDETCATAGICVAGTPPEIDDHNTCTADTCDGVLGVKHTPLPDQTSCDDGNACNGHESCKTGQCIAGIAPVLEDYDPCTTDSCSPDTGITHVPIPGCSAQPPGEPTPPPPPHLTAPSMPLDNPGGVNGTRPPR
jgi:hypothetical protein